MFDVAILGGGPAGCAAGVYAARKQLKTVLITETFGGQSIVSPGIENWIGDQVIPGYELAKKLEAHVKKYKSDEFVVAEGYKITDVQKIEGGFEITTEKETYQARTVLVTTGSDRRRTTTTRPHVDCQHWRLIGCAYKRIRHRVCPNKGSLNLLRNTWPGHSMCPGGVARQFR